MPKKIKSVLLISTTAALMTACLLSSAYLTIDYTLPVDTRMLNGQSVYLKVEDMRTVKDFLTPAALSKLRDFTGIFALYGLEPEKKRALIGSYETPELMAAAFKKRLGLLGIAMAPRQTSDVPVFTVSLHTFNLDLVENKWVAHFAYSAALSKGKNRAEQSLSGKTERVRLIDKTDAEKVLRDLFSDTMNKLDVMKLFKDAGIV